MATRKPLSKRTRFEVFKRDLFICQYCGKRPPAVVLHVDHIVPVSDGGNNRVDNLITSCADCNLGKSNVPLTAVAPSRAAAIKMAREAEEQIAAYSDLLRAKRDRERADMKEISDRYIDLMGEDPDEKVIAGPMKQSVEEFQRRLPVEEILDALNIAARRFHPSEYSYHRYFCGVCWRKIKGDL